MAVGKTNLFSILTVSPIQWSKNYNEMWETHTLQHHDKAQQTWKMVIYVSSTVALSNSFNFSISIATRARERLLPYIQFHAQTSWIKKFLIADDPIMPIESCKMSTGRTINDKVKGVISREINDRWGVFARWNWYLPRLWSAYDWCVRIVNCLTRRLSSTKWNVKFECTRFLLNLIVVTIL